MAGGAIYSNLDYSFTPDHEDGSAKVVDPTPGGGGPSLRRSLAALRTFIERFDFLRMKPDNRVIVGGIPQGATARALVDPGLQYAIYINGGTKARLELDLPPRDYVGAWVDPRDGKEVKPIETSGGRVTLESPDYQEDIALRIVARSK